MASAGSWFQAGPSVLASMPSEPPPHPARTSTHTIAAKSLRAISGR